MHKIAIIKTSDDYTYDTYGDQETRRIVESISDWVEISHEDYMLLQRASYAKGFKIIEQPVNTPLFVAATIAEYIEEQRAVDEKVKENKVKREAAALKKKHTKDLKTRESKIALLNQLQQELGIQEAKA